MTLFEEIPDHLGQRLINGSLEFFRIKGDLFHLRCAVADKTLLFRTQTIRDSALCVKPRSTA